ncbi:hypothetical protein BGZ47_000279, partial [Haplosporangium gracile]
MLCLALLKIETSFTTEAPRNGCPPPSDSDLGGVLRLKFLRMLAHLRKVVLQDAVALMNLSFDDYMNYARHDVFDNLIFKDDLFLKYRPGLLSAMDSAIPLQSDLLSHNAPAIHTEFRNLDSKMTNGFAGTRSDMRAFTQEIKSTMDSSFQLLEKTISAKIGNAMGQQSDSLRDFLSTTLNQPNLAFSRATQRVYQEKQRIMSIYQEELQGSLERTATRDTAGACSGAENSDGGTRGGGGVGTRSTSGGAR